MDPQDRTPIPYRPHSEPGEDREGSRSSYKLSPKAVVGLVVVAGLLIVGSVGAVKWTEARSESRSGEQTAALKTAWEKNQKSEAQGVDFRMFLESTSEPRKPTLDFKHDGTVTAKDACYSAQSDYIVLQDGSLAVRDLSKPKEAAAGGCGGVDPSAIFMSSKLSFKDGGWTAYDARGSKLVGALKEHARPATTSDS